MNQKKNAMACDIIYNKYHGWTKREVEDIFFKSLTQ